MKILGKRKDGVVLVNIGANIAYAVDLERHMVANMGDVLSPAVQSSVWEPVERAEASDLRWPVQQMLDGKGRTVSLSAMEPREPEPTTQPPPPGVDVNDLDAIAGNTPSGTEPVGDREEETPEDVPQPDEPGDGAPIPPQANQRDY